MADYRPIKIKIWNDTWFLNLSDKKKVIWLFLLSNTYTHISGIYELPKILLTPLVGAYSEVEKILKGFEDNKKIVYKEGWIYIKNYIKNQGAGIKKQDNITKHIIAYFSENPHLVDLFNLRNEAPYKSLVSAEPSPLPKVIKSKVIKSKGTSEQSSQNPKSIIEYFSDKVFSIKGYRPKISGAKEGALIKSYLKEHEKDYLKEYIDWFIESKEAIKLGCSLSVAFSSTIFNKWLEYKQKTAWQYE